MRETLAACGIDDEILNIVADPNHPAPVANVIQQQAPPDPLAQPAPPNADVAQQRIIRANICKVLRVNCDETRANMVRFIVEPREIMRLFVSTYANVSNDRANQLKTQYEAFSLEIRDKESFAEQLNEFRFLVGKLAGLNIIKTESEMVVSILNSLPTELNTKKQIWEEQNLDWVQLFNKVVDQEPSLMKIKDVQQQAMNAIKQTPHRFTAGRRGTRGFRGRKTHSHQSRFDPMRMPPRCQNCGMKNPNHSISECTKDKRHDLCKICSAPNHSELECWYKKKSGPPHNNNMYAMVAVPLTFALNAQTYLNDCWIIDSGCSQHMVKDRNTFLSLEESDVQIQNANNSIMKAKGKGTVVLESACGTIELREALYVPEMQFNLISLSRIAEHNLKAIFDGHECTIMHREGKIVLKGINHNGLYIVNTNRDSVNYPLNSFNQASEGGAKVETLWHQRLGHIGIEKVNQMLNHNMVTGIDEKMQSNIRIIDCENCIAGKTRRQTHKSSDNKVDKPLERISSDVEGPIHPPTKEGYRYIITFIDEFTRFTVGYFLKKKSEALNCFMLYKAYAERQQGRKILTIRTDNGGEYTSNEFARLLANDGILHQKTVAHTPEQNGIAERKFRAVLESMRTLKHNTEIPDHLWKELAATAIFYLNRTPAARTATKTPLELWTGRKPDISMYRAIGCIAFGHIPKVLRNSKLDPVVQKGILVGYDISSKAYRIFNPITNKIFLAVKPTFQEDMYKFTTDRPVTSSELKEKIDTWSHEADSDQEVPDQEVPATQQPHVPDDFSVQAPLPNITRQVLRQEHERRTTQRFGFLAVANSLDDVESIYCMAMLPNSDEPATIKEAMTSMNWKEWRIAMDEEIEALISNNTWEIVKLPKDRTQISCKWIFKKKRNQNGQVVKFKARLVARGFSQQKGIDFNETFAPVLKFNSLRTLLSLAALYDFEVEQMDVATAFLNGDLQEEIYMEIPTLNHESDSTTELIKAKRAGYVFILKRSIYGLRQASREWNRKIDTWLNESGFCRCKTDHAVYFKREVSFIMIITLYVDDILIIGNDKQKIAEFKSSISNVFKMKDLGPVSHLIGIEIIRNRTSKTITITQRQYLKDVLRKFDMQDCDPIDCLIDPHQTLLNARDEGLAEKELYQSAVGSIIYLLITRPDIAYVASVLAREMSSPRKVHWRCVKQLFKYLAGTVDTGITYGKAENSHHQITAYGGDTPMKEFGFSDSNYAHSNSNYKSTSGYVFILNGGAISWEAKRQTVLARSTTEAEYIGLGRAASQAVWLRAFLLELGLKDSISCLLMGDNQAALKLIDNPKYHDRTKHINVQFHYIREQVNDKAITLKYVSTKNMTADVFTKVLKKHDHQRCMHEMGMEKIK